MSFQVSTMQLLAEAHNHEEGWFQKQMCALVLKAGSDQGSLGSRGNARGQGGSHATCAEAWPSSSDEGGPSYGAREALVVQKGKSGTAGTRSTSLRGAGTSSTARKRSGPRVELAVRGLEDKGLGAGPDRRFKTPPGTGASKGKRKRVACLGNKGVTLPGIVSSPGPQVLELGLAGDAEARMISAVVKGVQLALLPMTTLLSTKQAVEACKSSERQGGSDSVLDGGSNRGTVGGELAQVSLGGESTAGCTLSTVPKVIQDALASATALPVQVAGQGADLTTVVSLLGEHPVVNSGAGQGTGLGRPLAGSKRLPDAAYGDSCTTISRSLGVHLSKEVKEKIWAGDYVEILSLLPGYNEAVAKSGKKRGRLKRRMWKSVFFLASSVIGRRHLGFWRALRGKRIRIYARRFLSIRIRLEKRFRNTGGRPFVGQIASKGSGGSIFRCAHQGEGVQVGSSRGYVGVTTSQDAILRIVCRFQHTCAGCGGQHPKSKCFKKDSKGFKGAGQQAVQEGGNASFSRGNGALAGKIPQ
ncbi:uncharacterized protein LOC142477139 [Ascaphus truei]|uniref:uncharacterized protein LOC142477139 n=1 Tax=Ascaphus truei TaxID=8439 RepID=UPI003F594C3D